MARIYVHSDVRPLLQSRVAEDLPAGVFALLQKEVGQERAVRILGGDFGDYLPEKAFAALMGLAPIEAHGAFGGDGSARAYRDAASACLAEAGLEGRLVFRSTCFLGTMLDHVSKLPQLGHAHELWLDGRATGVKIDLNHLTRWACAELAVEEGMKRLAAALDKLSTGRDEAGSGRAENVGVTRRVDCP